MMTSVHLLNFVPNGRRSMETYLLLLADALKNRGWKTLYAFAGNPSEEFAANLSALETEYLVTAFPLDGRSTRDMAKKLRNYKPDVLQSYFMSPFNLSLARLKHSTGARRFIFTDQTSGVASPKSGVKRLLASLRGAAAGTYIDRIVAVSEFVARRDIEGSHLPRTRVRVIHNGADPRRYQPASDKLAPADLPTIGFVGQLIPEKGVLTLLRAIHLLQTEMGPIRALIAGRGHQHDELTRYCEEYKLRNVEFLGQIDDVPQLFSSVDVVVVPSEWEEACAFSLIEAMFCGACLLVSDAGGNPELVGTDGDAGLTFQKGDVAGLAASLQVLFADPDRRARMRNQARARAIGAFSIQRMVAQYVSLYDELQKELNGGTR